jgi:uncharacterized membrane protein
MHKIEQVVTIDRPVNMVYDQWTRFEKWESEITEQEPDRRISWKAINGVHNAGTVRFKPLGQDRTEIHLLLVYETNGARESMGHALGRIGKRVKASLLEFKNYAERPA